MIQQALLWAAAGTGFTFLMTTIGAAMVFFMKRQSSALMQQIFLGFASGVMIAASIWSLILPAFDNAGKTPVGAAVVSLGFLLGCLGMLLLDKLVPHQHMDEASPEGRPSHMSRPKLLVLAVALHNIPEGMAVGLSFSVAALEGGSGALAGAVALAIGMGLQNFPEGAAVSLPLKSQGVGTWRAFACGAASGVVEPVFGLLTVLAAGSLTGIMPWILSFAAGAMIYVVVEELIPEAQLGEHSHAGTVSVMLGFLVMMALDVTLG